MKERRHSPLHATAMRGFAVGLLLLAGSCKEEATPGPRPTPMAAVSAYCGADYLAVEQRIDTLLETLTVDDKVYMSVGDFPGVRVWHAPGLPQHGIPDMFMLDGPRGVSRVAGDATAFPVGMARGATFDPELEARVGEAIGAEIRAVGRNVLLAPTMNVLTHPRWGRAQETYGEDSFHIGSMAVGFVVGAQTQLPVTAKHYAVNNIENTRHEVNVTVDERTLREVYLPHFERVVRDAHVASVMSSYNSVNGFYCSENAYLLRDVLKDEWDFAGFVVSDWGGTEFNTVGFDHTIAAATAGLDLEMFTPKIYGGDLYSAVIEGDVDEAYLDDMIRRQLRARFCHDLDTNPPVADPSALALPATVALAREVAERSLVLLKNEGAALPAPRGAGVNIVVTGPLADVENLGDLGSSAAKSANVVTALEGIVANAQGATVTHLAAPPANQTEEDLVANADVVIVVAGLGQDDEGEADIGAGDRDSLALSAEQLAWIASLTSLSTRVVVVLEGGSAIDVGPFLNDVEALVDAWYPGLEGGSAIARALFGDVNFSGRLPIVFPVSESDLPAFDNVSHEVTYDRYHGYRHLDRTGTAPRFPFGFGLSYTTFTYANVAVESATVDADDVVRVSFDVTNSGARAGRETPQLYVGAPSSAVADRFVRELRAFTQVDLAAGETQRITLGVPAEDLAYWDTRRRAFVVEPTAYLFEVGPSSRDLPLEVTVTVTR